jgi:aconitate decarboxylase
MSTVPHGTTRRVVEAALAIEPDDGQLAALSALLRDGLGVLVAGLRHPNIAILLEHVGAMGSRQVQVPTTRVRASSPDVAFVCGSAIHAMDFEPMFDPPTHAVSPVLGALVPLLVAANPHRPGDARRWMAAFAVGLQLQADLRVAARDADAEAARLGRHFPFQRSGFHPPGTVGVLGAALASARWLGLTVPQTCTALGIAASRAGALAANIGTMTKATHCGQAARAGLESALLAERGFTACTSIFEAPGGWGDIFGGDGFRFDRLQEGMVRLNCMHEPGFAFKRWPAHTAMQVAIQAALSLYRPEYLPGSVTITTPVLPYCDRPDPRDADEARFSFQACTALALHDGHVDAQSFTDEHLSRPSFRALLHRITLVRDPLRTAAFPSLTLRIELDDGRSVDGDRWPGHWKSPATTQQLAEKFAACTTPVLGASKSRALDKAVRAAARGETLEPLRRALLRSTR